MSLPSPRLLACTLALLALPLAASAQRVVDRDLQQEMSPSEFKAAGLDKLSADELSRLNHWLQGTVEAAATQAVKAAREEGRQEDSAKRRGFFDSGSREPITSVLPGAFNGFAKGRIYMLANGQHWEQTDDASIGSARRQDPRVTIAPGLGSVWYLKIDGVNTRAKVKRVK